MKEKSLVFVCSGVLYKISTAKKTMGQVMIYGEHKFKLPHPSWKILGVSFHHWRNGIDLTIAEATTKPKSLIGGIVWDVDHGTVRTWGGRYLGKLPRITQVYE